MYARLDSTLRLSGANIVNLEINLRIFHLILKLAYKNNWVSYGDWLGTGFIAPQNRVYRSIDEAKKFVHSLGLKSHAEWVSILNLAKGGGAFTRGYTEDAVNAFTKEDHESGLSYIKHHYGAQITRTSEIVRDLAQDDS